jgi:hypothetical protein
MHDRGDYKSGWELEAVSAVMWTCGVKWFRGPLGLLLPVDVIERQVERLQERMGAGGG